MNGNQSMAFKYILFLFIVFSRAAASEDLVILEPSMMAGEVAAVMGCSRSFCERLGVQPPGNEFLTVDQDVGVEFYAESMRSLKLNDEIKKSRFCRMNVFFPSSWGLYTPNGLKDWIEIAPRKNSVFLRSTRFGNDSIINKTSINWVHSYLSSTWEDEKGKKRKLINSASATQLHEEVVPGISMAALRFPCADIHVGGNVEIFIPNKSAYPKGANKTKGDINGGNFNKISISPGFFKNISYIFN